MSHPLQCRCGTLKGFVDNPSTANRAVCYCKDCQAFAHFLGRSADVLDERGGSDVVQILPKNITFTQGVESLACHPKTTTHSGMTKQELEQAGIGDGLVRVSVGIEDWRDLLADFDQALSRI